MKRIVIGLACFGTLAAAEPDQGVREYAGYACRKNADDRNPQHIYGSFQGLGKIDFKIPSQDLRAKIIQTMGSTYCSTVELKGTITDQPRQMVVEELITDAPAVRAGSVFIVSKIGMGNTELTNAATQFREVLTQGGVSRVNYINEDDPAAALVAVVATAYSERELRGILAELEPKINKPSDENRDRTLHIQRLHWADPKTNSGRHGSFVLKH